MVIGGALLVPSLLVYGCMKAVHWARRREAETSIRETEAALRQEELRHQRLRGDILEKIAEGVREAGPDDLRIPEGVLVEATRAASTTVRT